tara:strand:+ start:371 stop:712 length:342 start_codon:yes stop_codon:yes gene_type:complete
VAADRPVPSVLHASPVNVNLLIDASTPQLLSYPPAKYPAVPEFAIPAKVVRAVGNPLPSVLRESSENANLSTTADADPVLPPPIKPATAAGAVPDTRPFSQVETIVPGLDLDP